MSRYSSKAELQAVIKMSVYRGGLDPADVIMSRVYRDMKITGGGYYGWTCDLDADPVEIARKHMRTNAA